MKSVVICGSTRFVSEIREFAQKLKELGVLVYEPNLYSGYDKVSEPDKKFLAMGLTHDHFRKMKMADVVYVYNKDGYVGVSTNMEIGFAVAIDKPIYVLEEKDEEIFRKNLFTAVVKTPEELLNYLK
jgi:hypothetical protein